MRQKAGRKHGGGLEGGGPEDPVPGGALPGGAGGPAPSGGGGPGLPAGDLRQGRGDLQPRPVPPVPGGLPLRAGQGDQGRPGHEQPGAGEPLRGGGPLPPPGPVRDHHHRPYPLRCGLFSRGAGGGAAGRLPPLPPELHRLPLRAHPLSEPEGGGPHRPQRHGQAGPVAAGDGADGGALPRHRALPPAGREPGLPLPGLRGPGGGGGHPADGKDHRHPGPEGPGATEGRKPRCNEDRSPSPWPY